MDGVESASSEMMAAVDAPALKKNNWASIASALILAAGVPLTLVWAGFWIWLLAAVVSRLFH
jgi:hypothetical protein